MFVSGFGGAVGAVGRLRSGCLSRGVWFSWGLVFVSLLVLSLVFVCYQVRRLG